VTGRSGRIDVLASTAGAGTGGAAGESSVAQAQGVFDVNVFGLIRMTKAVLPHMRARGRGRIIDISSMLGFIPAPYMAVYAASKHAAGGYSESLDHEVREHGIRVLLAQPAVASTPFDTNMVQADTPLPACAQQRRIVGDVMAAAMKDGDDPAIVARVIVAAATGPKPRLRYAAGPAAGRVRTLRRVVPARVSGKQIRRLNRLAGVRQPAPAADGAAAAVASSRLP